MFITGAFSPPLLRPFPPFDGAVVIRIKPENAPKTKPLRYEVEILLQREVGLDVINPVFVETSLSGYYPGVSLVPHADRGHITVGIQDGRTNGRIAEQYSPKI